ncbi:MAG: ABC transporter substrate-binding protein [Sandaracinus sp.]
MSRLALRLLATLAFSLLLVPAGASAQGGPATRYLRQRHTDVDHIMERQATTDAERTARDAEVTQILVSLLDFDELSHQALAAHWDDLTPAQRTEFTSLLRQLVERNYRTNLERIRDYQVDYTREETIANGVVVHTEAHSRASRREPPIAIDYTMHRVGSDWRVVDVVTDAASLVHNYQQQFHRIITRDGFDTLLTRMRDRLAREGGASGATGGASAPH